MPIVDLRDYRTARGGRDALIERCESVLFVEQRRLGARFPGLLRDPDRFVWLREMPDLADRKRIMTAFYTHGDLWKAQRAEVNRWIRDSSDVLLLQPLEEVLPAPDVAPAEIAMIQCLRDSPLRPDEAEALQGRVRAAVAAAGGAIRNAYATDPAENNYPPAAYPHRRARARVVRERRVARAAADRGGVGAAARPHGHVAGALTRSPR